MMLRIRLASLRLLVGRRFSRREDILRYQSHRLRCLVRQAADHVPYYRARFAKHGLDADRVEGVQDLERIPLTSKSDLLSTRPEDLLHRRLRHARLSPRTTSGSTGTPFTVHCTPFEDRFLSALRFRVLTRMGVRVTDRVAHITFFKSGVDYGRPPGLLNRGGLFRTVLIDSALSQFEIARRLESLRPDVIRGYSNLTSLVADAIQAEPLTVRPRLVITGGDNLTPAMRDRMVAAFQAPVRQVYGSREVSLAAWECDRSGQLHVCEEAVILEVLRDGRPVEVGERGELVATALHSFAQPFIRYRLGDIVTRGAETCPCGLPYATIQSVEGRIYDRIILPDGRAASPSGILSRVKDGFRWVRQYQLVQERPDLVVLRLVSGEAPAPDDLTRIHQMMAGFLGPGVQHQIDLVDAIALDRTGKVRASMSRVFSNYEEPGG